MRDKEKRIAELEEIVSGFRSAVATTIQAAKATPEGFLVRSGDLALLDHISRSAQDQGQQKQKGA